MARQKGCPALTGLTDRYAKDKARLLASAVLEAGRKILGEWYDGEPAR